MNIPNLPFGKIVNEDGTPTDEMFTYLQNLTTALQNNASDEGLIAPTQTAAKITVIQNNQLENSQYTCGYGRFIYDSTNNKMWVSINNGANVPIFKEIQLI